MKILNVTENVEKSLNLVFDCALKYSGVNVFAAIQHIINAIETKPEHDAKEHKNDENN